jgi:hypothetical protein
MKLLRKAKDIATTVVLLPVQIVIGIAEIWAWRDKK